MAIITPGTTNQAAASNTPAGQATIGKVVILQGQVQATAADGTVRILSPNSLVFANDHIVTGSDGNLSLFIVGNPPTQMDIGRMSNVTRGCLLSRKRNPIDGYCVGSCESSGSPSPW